MKVAEVRELARQHGLKTTRKTKTNMIKQIQLAEGNFDCFSTATNGYCNQDSCLWRPDCFKAA
jgi:hypothetical protein